MAAKHLRGASKGEHFLKGFCEFQDVFCFVLQKAAVDHWQFK